MSHDARAIANFLLDYGDSRGRAVTIMTLLKVLYFAQGWSLAKFDRPLIRNDFEAWEHGPVVRAVYEAFRGSRDQPISTRALRFDVASEKFVVAAAHLADEDSRFLRQVMDAYGDIHALALSEMTHESGSPWDRVWNAPNREVTLGMRIDREMIREHFVQQRPPKPLA